MSKRKEIKIYTLDTETYGLDGKIKRLAIYDGENVMLGYKFSEFVNYFKAFSETYQIHIYIHNLDFDARKMPEIFEFGNVLWNQCIIVNNSYVKISCKHYTLHCSYHLLPRSLMQLSKDFELENSKLDLWDEIEKNYPGKYKNKDDFFRNCHPDNKLYIKYLKLDVISLYELIYKLIDISGIPVRDFVKCITTSSISKYIFKHGYKSKLLKSEAGEKTDYDHLISNKYWYSDKKVVNNTVSYRDIEYKIRDAYYGGRVEVFKPYYKSDQYLYHYDVNSLYPSVMIDHSFPVGVPSFYNEPYYIEFLFHNWMINKKGLGFIKCKVLIPQQNIPPLPVYLGKLTFPCGYIEGTWTFHELYYAIKECGVKVIEYEELIFFKKTCKLFHSYVKIFSNLKEEAKKDGNISLVTFAKLLLNVSYGWTGMRRDDKLALDDISKYDQYIDKGIDVKVKNNELGFIQYPADIRSNTIQVQVAAYVTSYARLKLLHFLKMQDKKGNVYYCDTDSIVCDTPLDKKYVDKYKLGFWDLENEVNEAIFLQPKTYYEKSVTDAGIKINKKFKGVKTKTRREINFLSVYQELYQILKEGEQNQLPFDRFLLEKDIESLPSLIVSQKQGMDGNYLNIRDKYYNLNAIPKRRMFYNDNKTEPYYIPSFDDFYNFNLKPSVKNQCNLLVRRQQRGIKNV